MIQLTFTCSKSTLETLENFSTVSIVDFEQVNVSWEIILFKHPHSLICDNGMYRT